MSRIAPLSLAALVFAFACGGNDAPTGPTAPTKNSPPTASPSPVPTTPTKHGRIYFATASAGGMSISTDKDDYAPGDTVKLTGAGWTPGDTVDLKLTDDSLRQHNWAVGVDGNGGFRDSTYVVAPGDVGVTFTLVATSRSTGKSLTVEFTDANLNVMTSPEGVTAVVGVIRYDAAGCTGNSNVAANETANVGPTGSVSFSLFSSGTNTTTKPASILFTAPATSTLGAHFSSWTAAAGTTATIDNPTRTACVSNQTGSPAITANYSDAAPDLTISKALSGAFSVGTPGGTYTITVSNVGTASATSDATTQITVTDVLPTGLGFSSGGSQNNWQACTAVGQTVTCKLAPNQSITPGDSKSFPLAVNVLSTACPSVNNSASITNAGTTAESNTNNNGSGNVLTTISSGCPVSNHSPTANAGPDQTGNEGALIEFDGSGSSDPDAGDVIHYLWTVDYTTTSGVYKAIDNGGSCSFVDPDDNTNTRPDTLAKPHIRCTDDSNGGKFKVTLTVTDSHGASDDDTADLTVNNVAPAVSLTAAGDKPADYSVWAITAPEFLTAGFVTASFSDAGTNDTHTCTIDWGITSVLPVAGTVEEVGGAGTCKSVAGNPYTAYGAGIYTITVKVTDDDTGEGTATVTIVVYDPSAGFVTGGGWINSPAGAYFADPSLFGRANFGFVSKYLKGNNVPTGNTEFQFQAGKFNFHSDTYDWLVVNQNGVNAQFKGNGLINGQNCAPADFEGKCRFMLWAYDGTKNGGYDTFRISIWTEDGSGNKTYIYDNGTGNGFSNDPIAGGSIQVQTGKK